MRRGAAFGAVIISVVAVVFRLVRRNRKARVIDVGTVSQGWLAAERGIREDRL
jgi:hypothetical protein